MLPDSYDSTVVLYTALTGLTRSRVRVDIPKGEACEGVDLVSSAAKLDSWLDWHIPVYMCVISGFLQWRVGAVADHFDDCM